MNSGAVNPDGSQAATPLTTCHYMVIETCIDNVQKALGGGSPYHRAFGRQKRGFRRSIVMNIGNA
jgi:hypothetical protein